MLSIEDGVSGLAPAGPSIQNTDDAGEYRAFWHKLASVNEAYFIEAQYRSIVRPMYKTRVGLLGVDRTYC